MATINKIPFNPENHEEFVALRNRLHAENRLGGSDLGTAAGVNKYKSRLRFYNEMLGIVNVPDISNKQSIKDGILCEDLVAKKFEERTGKSVHRVNAIQTSDAAPHLFASIDRKVENEDAGLECKTANALNWDAFKGGKLPDSYVKQIKTYMKVTGYRTWYCYVWVMGCAEYCYIFTQDESLLDAPPAWADLVIRVTEMELDECEDVAADWFNSFIIPGIAPECDGSEDETDFLKEISPESTSLDVIALTQTTESDLDELATLKESVKSLETQIATIENTIKAEIGNHAEATIGSRKVTYKNNKASSKIDWKGVSYSLLKDLGGTDPVFDKCCRENESVKPGSRVLRIGKAK